MRGLIIIVLIAILLFMGGWLTFNRSSDRAVISLETQEIKEDTAKAVEKGKDLFNKVEEKTEDALDRPK